MENEYDVLDEQGDVVWTPDEDGWHCTFDEGLIRLQQEGNKFFPSYAVQVAYLSDEMEALGISAVISHDQINDVEALEGLILSLVRKAKSEAEGLVESKKALRSSLPPSILRIVNSLQ